MFEVRFSNAILLKRILDAVKDLVDDVNWLCTEDGIELQSMDSSHVALVSVTILPDACSLYTCTDAIRLGMNVSILAKIIRCAENDDAVLLRQSKDEASLEIEFESRNGSRRHEFAMNLMDLDTQHLQIPDLEYTCSVKLPSSEFSRIVKDMATFGELATISVRESTLSCTTTGDGGKSSILVKQDTTAKAEKLWTDINCSTNTEMMFALKYLVAFTKAQHIAEQVTLFMVKDSPMYVLYDMDTKGSIGFYLAPRQEE